MTCPHAQQLDLHPPRPSQPVYREDCTQCFDSIDDPAGLDVCLQCYNGGCAGDRQHNSLHSQRTGHPLVVNIRRTKRRKQREEPPQKMTKLAIAAETEEDKYETRSQVNCFACQMENIDQSLGRLQETVNGILSAMTFSKQEEVKAWEQELTECEHTLCLQQHPRDSAKPNNLEHCNDCELRENLWLCLECGNLGCGRKQHGGAPGNGHGVAHTNSSGHAVAVKLGSLTAEGSADVYCYACDEERIDSELVQHLAHWGINIADRVQTEKTLSEQNIEQNLKWDFSMVTEDGKELQPLFGRELTGLKNIGNSCYLASTVQCLFDLPEFQQRYYQPSQPLPAAVLPAEDLETQMRKLADGLVSGRYSRPQTNIAAVPDTPEVPHQNGINPAMFKHLVGRGHEEFSTMRQQDAFEFLAHLFKLIGMSNRSTPDIDPIQSFRFVLEQKLQCVACKKVRYTIDEQDNISIPVPVRRLPAQHNTIATTNGEEKEDKPQFESVTLKECLDIFTSVDTVEYSCPSCSSNAFLKSSKFKTFPQNLAVNARRFELVNWVPTKLDIPVEVSDEPFDMTPYVSQGLQPGEEELPQDIVSAATQFQPNESAINQLLPMGFPRPRIEKALYLTGNTDAEAAMNWLFTHMDDPDVDVPMDFAAEATKSSNSASGADESKISQLAEMGIPAPQARKALRECDGNVERALDWVFSHPDDQGDFGEKVASEPVVKKELSGSNGLPAIFQLESIACHKGSSIHAGHYVAFIRKRLEGEKSKSWVLFNDEKVVRADHNVEDMKKFAYVYFFRRQ